MFWLEERHVRFVTKKLVDNLLSNGQALGKARGRSICLNYRGCNAAFLAIQQLACEAFCEIDPERHYAISKDQFANAVATACTTAAICVHGQLKMFAANDICAEATISLIRQAGCLIIRAEPV